MTYRGPIHARIVGKTLPYVETARPSPRSSQDTVYSCPGCSQPFAVSFDGGSTFHERSDVQELRTPCCGFLLATYRPRDTTCDAYIVSAERIIPRAVQTVLWGAARRGLPLDPSEMLRSDAPGRPLVGVLGPLSRVMDRGSPEHRLALLQAIRTRYRTGSLWLGVKAAEPRVSTYLLRELDALAVGGIVRNSREAVETAGLLQQAHQCGVQSFVLRRGQMIPATEFVAGALSLGGQRGEQAASETIEVGGEALADTFDRRGGQG